MRVRVKLFATLGNFAPVTGLPGTPFEIDLPEGADLSILIDRLKIPAESVKIAFVNGIIQPPNFILTDGDDVGIFPPIGGG
ncbi:MAG: MoaD/ThiS family protein [Anaerolineaceae bacterium]|nr:MoaD/ThiS family protein [Anaerolineaceae bacterium]